MKAVPLRCKITSVSNIFKVTSTESRKRNKIYKFGKGRKTVTFQRQNNFACRKSFKKNSYIKFLEFSGLKYCKISGLKKQLGRECSLLTPIKIAFRIGSHPQLAS